MLQFVALAALSTSLLGGPAATSPAFTAENITLAPGASGVVHTTGPESVRGALLVQSNSAALHLDSAFGADCEAINTPGAWMCGDMTSTWDLNGGLGFTLDELGTQDGQVISTAVRVVGSDAETEFMIAVEGDAVELEGFTAEADGARVSGTGTPGAKVQGLDENGEAVAATLVDSDGTWSTHVWDDGSLDGLDLWVSESLDGENSASVEVHVDFS